MSLFHRLGQQLADFLGERTDLDALASPAGFASDCLNPDYLADLLPYRLYDEEYKIYENTSSLGFLIEVIPLLGAGEQTQQEISALIREIGDEGASIQCLCFADPRIDRFLDAWSAPRKQKGAIYAEIARKKEAFLKNESLHGEVPPRIFRFFFSYSEPKKGERTLESSLGRLRDKKTKALEVFNRLSEKKAYDVEPFQLIEFLSGFVNSEKNTETECRRTWNKQTWISKQISLPGSSLEIGKEGILFHNPGSPLLLKTYEVTDYPDCWALGCMGELLGDFFNKSYRIPSAFYIQYGIYFPPQQALDTKFRAKAKMIDHQMKFPSMIRMFPDMPKEQAEHQLVHKQLLEGEKFVETRLSCGLWENPATHVASESILIALFQKYGFKLKANSFIHLPDFLSSLPMSWGEEAPYIKNLKRIRSLRTTVTSETGSLVPLIGEWWGLSATGMILLGRRGQIATWDPFGASGNLNTVVIGPSGKGKSVFMQDLILNHLAQGGRAYVLDLGRSFQNLCYLLEGQYLEFSAKNRLDLNPFNFIRADQDIDTLNSGIEMVSSIIATMAMPSQIIDKERANIIHALVKKAWELKKSAACVDDVIHLLDSVSFKSELMIGATESLKEGLKKFSKTGAYANYFYGTHAVDFTNDLVVIETEELKVMPDLQTVILQIFVLTISNQIFMGDRERRCLICIDEAWDLLKSPQMQGFIESLARRLRKYNGALLIGTQGLKDFDQSHGARAAFNNSNWLVMVGNDNDSINVLKRENIIPMDDFKERALGSLRMEEGKYGEVFIYYKGTGFFSINQLKLDPFSAMLYSTKALEFQAIQELKAQGLRLEQAINWLITHKQRFAALVNNGRKIKEAIAHLLSHTTQGDTHV